MKITKTIPSLIASMQSNKILEKVSKQKDLGYFSSEREYSAELRKQLIEAAETDGTAVFNFRPIQSGVAYSEYINESIEDIVSDMEVVFTELNYLFSKIRSHEVFFERSIFEIQNLLTKMERQLESSEIEAGLDNIYNRVSYDSFLDESLRMSLGNFKASELYFDRRQETKTTISDFAEMQTKVGELTVPRISNTGIKIASVDIVSTQTNVSEFDIQLPGATTQNLMSDLPSDIWSYQILTRKKLRDPAKLVLEINLGDKQEINQFSISPNSAIPMFFNSLSYENEAGDSVLLKENIGVLTTDKLLSFPTVIARRLRATLTQDKTESIPFDPTNQETTLQDLQRDPSLSINISAVADQVDDQIKDPNIKNILGLEQNRIYNDILLNQYLFSLNSLQVGYSDYKKKGDFVSKGLSISPPSLIGLESSEDIAWITDSQTGQQMPSGTIEYSLIKKDYEEEALIRTQEFNILPIGQISIDNEVLFFAMDKTQSLRFIGHSTDGDGSGVRIFRNGEELIIGVDWKFTDRNNISNPADTVISTTVGATKITIMHTDEQVKNGVYYADYSPRYTMSPSSIDHAVQYLQSGVTRHPLVYSGQTIEKSELFVKIILRNLTDTGISSPRLDYYRLLLKEESDD